MHIPVYPNQAALSRTSYKRKAFAVCCVLLAAAGCSTAGPMTAVAAPSKVLITDQNGNLVAQVSDSARVQPIAQFINDQRTHKPWRELDPPPIADIVVHLCRNGEMESMFGTQTRLFTSDGHDTPAQPEEVDRLLTLLGQDRTLFTRVPLKQAHSQVSCE